VARAAVRHAAPDALTVALVADCGLRGPEQLQEHSYANPERRYWARRAGVVFELAASGDPAAPQIADQAGADFAALVRVVSEVLGSAGPLVCAGGLLTHQPGLPAPLRAGLAADGITDVRLLDRDPVHGTPSARPGPRTTPQGPGTPACRPAPRSPQHDARRVTTLSRRASERI
jgi:N-acetylglucosamine kinase-like BadF-type ATPase